MPHPADVAFRAVEDIMYSGLAKEENGESWKTLSYLQHLGKIEKDLEAIKASGINKNQLKLALTRIAFILMKE